MSRPGLDQDGLIVLDRQPTDADRADADAIEAALDLAFAQINGVGIGLLSTSTVLSELERYDLGFFVACLCTPLLGEDLGHQCDLGIIVVPISEHVLGTRHVRAGLRAVLHPACDRS
jgi:hypothetical protein